MGLLEIVNAEATGKRQSLIINAMLTGVTNTIVMGCANAAAKNPDDPDPWLFAALVVSIVIFVLCYRQSSRQLTEIFEDVLLRIKLRLTDKIRRAELESIERIGTSEIYDRLTENMSAISSSATMIANFLRSVFMVAFGAVYMMYISMPGFALTTLLFVIGMLMYKGTHAGIMAHLQRTAQTRMSFFDRLTDLLRGFKEIKFSRRRSDALQENLTAVAQEMRSSGVKATVLLDETLLIPTVNTFAVLGAIAFVLPLHISSNSATISSLLAISMFIWGPIGGIMMGEPALLRANFALDNIAALEKKLDEQLDAPSGQTEDPWKGRFERIEAKSIEFSYPSDEEGKKFHVGPVSLTITAGEVLFIVGGNGSGKSTLLKVITGLYPARSGALKVDDTVIGEANVQAYREMISTVFADFHLFEQLYGFPEVDDDAVRRLLVQMHLDGQTSVVKGRFTSLNLSTGQRKRLALVVALLEDRPIYAFDEWAADQDPEFRKYFYEELIPDLKRRGKTVLVVTHDDRYFHFADRVAVMELGALRSIQVNQPDGPDRNPTA